MSRSGHLSTVEWNCCCPAKPAERAAHEARSRDSDDDASRRQRRFSTHVVGDDEIGDFPERQHVRQSSIGQRRQGKATCPSLRHDVLWFPLYPLSLRFWPLCLSMRRIIHAKNRAHPNGYSEFVNHLQVGVWVCGLRGRRFAPFERTYYVDPPASLCACACVDLRGRAPV